MHILILRSMKALWVIHAMYVSVLQISIPKSLIWIICRAPVVSLQWHLVDTWVFRSSAFGEGARSWTFVFDWEQGCDLSCPFCAAVIKQSSSTFPYSHRGNLYPFLIFWHLSINHSEINTFRHMNMNTHAHTHIESFEI